MPDDIYSSRDKQMAQRGMRGGFPVQGQRNDFPGRRFPRRMPIRQHYPGYYFFPVNYYGFPPGRCYWVDEYGRCCDRYGRCCDRFGRCYYNRRYGDMAYAPQPMDGWYGVPGGWDMMPGYDDMTDYDIQNSSDRNEE